jgi:hypothetical protein
MIFTEQAVDDLTPSMSCSDIEGSRLRLTTSNDLLDDVAEALPSSENIAEESEKVSVTVDLLKSLASPCSKSKVQREPPLSLTSHSWKWRSLFKICFSLLDINRKTNVYIRVSVELTYFSILEEKNGTYQD